MLQIVYVSTATRHVSAVDVADILDVSRRNNRRDGLTGLLYSDCNRFLQVLEGPKEAVEAAVARIGEDSRHRAIVILSRRTIEQREFGDWDMAHRQPGADSAGFIARVGEMVRSASPNVRATFEGFASVRNAA
ncbi:BLUF domain-containing protein [Stakelama marina]|uniref:BLUF domain-containing protein n=1 Tax=Stakelama marina TaxID=2826939 RepID=A0A8T4IC71_9SPHN|nr:BLUF domain-containing protein [Stakelama marina]MBR0551991.1 BLUF domain-containing protein [Stakelama marina]